MLPLVSIVFLCGLNSNGVTAKKSLNVLMYSPATGRSHLNFMGALADILVDAGHTVVSSFQFLSGTEKKREHLRCNLNFRSLISKCSRFSYAWFK